MSERRVPLRIPGGPPSKNRTEQVAAFVAGLTVAVSVAVIAHAVTTDAPSRPVAPVPTPSPSPSVSAAALPVKRVILPSPLPQVVALERHRVTTSPRPQAVKKVVDKPKPRATQRRASRSVRTGGTKWDSLMKCEAGSHGGWSANTGNGYYGGLQFSLTTWREFGGVGMPHRQSREAQIAVAERVLKVQGRMAWPGCTKKGAW